jgi:mRNA interferase RelE/StbE
MALSHDPWPTGCKALKGQWKGFHRIRAGYFRIIYQIEDDRLIIMIIRIGDRRDAYEPR